MPPGKDGLGNSRKKEGKELESVSSKIVGKWRRRRFGGRGVRGEGGRSDKTRFPNFFWFTPKTVFIQPPAHDNRPLHQPPTQLRPLLPQIPIQRMSLTKLPLLITP